VIKPNLVAPMGAETGVTTDPEVVRALVDRALADGAGKVLIVESGPEGAHFSECGYDIFNGYDPLGRVALVDLGQEPVVLALVPDGMAYKRIYIPELLLGEDVFFVSAAKLKTHAHTHASLTMKNLLGLPPFESYREPGGVWRVPMHRRGASQVIVDLNLVRPVDFALVDGLIGMEGNGPSAGEPVEMDLVLAGRNAVAVDRACLWATDLPPGGVKHLAYASRRGMGPADINEVELLGDPFTPRPFAWPTRLPPLMEYPRILPSRFVPGDGEKTTVIYRVYLPCRTRVEIVRTSDTSLDVKVMRTLHELESRPAGIEQLVWDGRDDDGAIVPPDRYTVRVLANYRDYGTDAYATGWVWVLPSRQ
jgi:uncharacterized protein (DUF362 family)